MSEREKRRERKREKKREKRERGKDRLKMINDYEGSRCNMTCSALER